MESSSRAELKVGATVIIALIIFIGGLLWLKGFRLERGNYIQAVWFPNIGTLTIGDPVSISGVTKGKVVSIDLENDGVKVGVSLTSDVALRSDAGFTVKNVGLMGERFVDIRTGRSSEPLPRDAMALGDYDSGIPEMMGLMGKMTEDVRDLVHTLRSTLGSDSTLSQLANVATSLDRVSEQTAELLSRNQEGVNRAVIDFGEAARSLRQTIETNDALISHSVQRIDSTTMKLSAFADRLDTLAVAAHQIVADFRDGDGTLPRLMRDDQLLKRWEQTALAIDELVQEIRANPKKYLKLDVSLF